MFVFEPSQCSKQQQCNQDFAILLSTVFLVPRYQVQIEIYTFSLKREAVKALAYNHPIKISREETYLSCRSVDTVVVADSLLCLKPSLHQKNEKNATKAW